MAVAVAACLAALLPIANISSVVMTAVAAYVIWSSPAGSPVRRAAIIFLAVTATLIWGRLFLGLFSRSLLGVDAFFVTNFIGSTQVGNKIAFIGQPGSIVVAPGCSSLQGISLAIVFWTTVNQWFSVKLTARSLAWCGAALGSALAINVVRIAALVNFPQHFDELHVGWGAELAAWTTMLAIVLIVIWGARREVFAQT
jgi:exosortase/archaeosortase family protein